MPGSERSDPKLLSPLAKALWKQQRKSAEPALTPAELSSAWKGLRTADAAAHAAAKAQAKALMRALAKAGYRLEPAPPGEAGEKRARARARRDKAGA